MNKEEVLRQIRDVGVVPVVRARSSDEAARVVEAIKAGGVSVLEITMTVPRAVELIAELSERYGDEATVGAGTVLDPETARACVMAGARFVVPPWLNTKTIELCRRYGVAVMPGALTPTEVVAAWQAGADMVKVFPCDSLGGARYIQSLKAPLPQIEVVPTGGVSLKTVADFIKAGASAVGVGSELVDVKALREGQADLIAERARQFVEAVREARQALTP